MPARDILQLGNPLLWESSLRVEDLSATSNQEFVKDLGDTLAHFRGANGFGRGIAAPQIGSLLRMIFIRMHPVGFCGPLINPEIVWSSNDRVELWDDCFSIPGLMVRVSRAASIRVAYQDERGAAKTMATSGDLAELLQHEIDHLDGILAVQRAVSPTAFSTREEWERRSRGRSAAP